MVMAWTMNRSYHQLASSRRLQSSISSSTRSSVWTRATHTQQPSTRTNTAVRAIGSTHSNHGIRIRSRRRSSSCHPPHASQQSQTTISKHNVISSVSFNSCSTSSSTRLYSSSRYNGFPATTTTTTKDDDDETIRVSYVTDIEGDKLYLDRYVDNSKILTWETISSDNGETNPPSPSSYSLYSSKDDEDPSAFPDQRRIEFLHSSNNNNMLVFGGDIWDKGGYDLYVTRQLLDLKRRYPTRVVWVLGNRDLNKIRIPQELGLPPPPPLPPAGGEEVVVVPYHPGLTWFRGSGRVGDPEGPLPSMVPGERLRWILGRTMGSPDAMEHRRKELEWEARGCPAHFPDNGTGGYEEEDATAGWCAVSDEQVVKSYQESCHPRGEMGRFLSQGLLP